MPSFYSLTLPSQLPLTPPEYLPAQHVQCNGGFMQYPQDMYATAPKSASELRRPSSFEQSRNTMYPHQGMGMHERGMGRDGDRYAQPHSAGVHQQSFQSSANGYRESTTLAPLMGFYEPMGAPLLPPMRMYGQQGYREMDVIATREHEQAAQNQQQSNEGKVSGGVSAKLDYEIETMTDFVADMATRVYALYTSPICMADIDIVRSVQPGTPTSSQFRKWVSQVLHSTRLPSATILLSLGYLCKRLTQMQSVGGAKFSDGELYRYLTVALILGSKFLDDNTFINRSWSEVSGIKVSELNRIELTWLNAFQWILHCDPNEADGFSTWSGRWKDYNARKIASTKPARLSPINTSMHHQHSVSQNFSPYPTSSVRSSFAEGMESARATSYTPSGFPHFESWRPQVSSFERSSPPEMSSAALTPDYYGGSGVWAPPEGFPHRSTLQWPTYSQLPTPTYTPSGYMQHWPPSAWAAHGHRRGCICEYCHPVAPYMMAPAYGMQTVAG